jgi:diguanylate cyclase (GGDEF)-like protein/PAS domain S-box-containing protein
LRENRSLTRDLEDRVEARTAELQANQQRFQALVQHSSDVVTILDRAGVVQYQSPSAHRVFGFSSDVVGRPFAELVEVKSRTALERALRRAAHQPFQTLTSDLVLRHAAGHACEAETTMTNLLDEPSVQGFVLNTRDVSERKALENQLVHDAFHDSLTGLANRALFEKQVKAALHSPEARRRVAVLFMDLDGFKEVNDSLGHGYGDQLLVHVADRLLACVRPGTLVARLGGDEFAVLMQDARDIADAVVLAQRIGERLQQIFLVNGCEIHITASVGIADAITASDAETLLRNVDLAMYRAKSAREGGHAIFDPEMHEGLVQRLELEADLRRAVHNHEFSLNYQPLFDIASGRVTGAEALLRWRHPIRGFVSPADFVPLAEAGGLIHEIGKWVLQEACRQAAEWRRTLHGGPFTVSVNLSGRQLGRDSIIDDVAAALESAGLDPAGLVLEMTESILLDNTDDVLARLRQLKSAGLQLAIDDFGTGYSSLSYLHRFPVDILKIDRSFVERLGGQDSEEKLVATILSLGTGLGLNTVAEGVENHGQLLALRRLGCHVAQGYHLGRPMPAEALSALLQEQAGLEGGTPPREPGVAAALTAAGANRAG